MAKRDKVMLSTILLLALVLLLSPASYNFLLNLTVTGVPRPLRVGDEWTYKVTYPDGESYSLTESVEKLANLGGTGTYLILRDDPQHISTEYLWITTDWLETKTFQPHIGNLDANTTVTYRPGIELISIPLQVGTKWLVNSSITILTELHSSTTFSVGRLMQEREVKEVDTISTPAGTFHAFLVTVTMNQTEFETLLFDTALGQVVKAEYHNNQEVVTQTLLAYSEAARSSSAVVTSNPVAVASLKILRKTYLDKTHLFLPS
jgi:hypothetical protein